MVHPGEFWADKEYLWKTILNYLDIVKHTRSNEMIVFTGDFGCGTTLTLLYLKNHLEREGALAAYIVTPIQGNIEDMYKSFIEALPLDLKERIFTEIAQDLLPKEAADRLRIGRIEYTYEEMMRIISIHLSKSRSLSLQERRIVRELLELEPDTIELWSRILLGLGKKEWPVFILVDEFDAALFATLDSREILYNLRRLYDDTLQGLCLVIGLKGEPKDAKKKLGEALFSRMTLQPIHLYPLSKTEAETFIREIIQNELPKRSSKSSYYPFTKKAVELLVETQCPVLPRRLLRICSLVFESANIEGLKKIDRSFVEKIISNFGQISLKGFVDENRLVHEPEDSGFDPRYDHIEAWLFYGAEVSYEKGERDPRINNPRKKLVCNTKAMKAYYVDRIVWKMILDGKIRWHSEDEEDLQVWCTSMGYELVKRDAREADLRAPAHVD